MKLTALYSLFSFLTTLCVASVANGQSAVCDPTDVPQTDGCHFSKKCNQRYCWVEEGKVFNADLNDLSTLVVEVDVKKPTAIAPEPGPSPLPPAITSRSKGFRHFRAGLYISGFQTAGDWSFGGGPQLEWHERLGSNGHSWFVQARGIIGTAGDKTNANFGIGASLGPGIQLKCGLRLGVRGVLLYYPETDRAIKERGNERWIGAEAVAGWLFGKGFFGEISGGYGARWIEKPGIVWHGRASIASVSVGWMF